MAPPASVVDALDVPIDPELVHDFAKAINRGVREKRAKFLRSVQQIGFHTLEDDAGMFGEGMHLSSRTAAPPFGLGIVWSGLSGSAPGLTTAIDPVPRPNRRPRAPSPDSAGPDRRDRSASTEHLFAHPTSAR